MIPHLCLQQENRGRAVFEDPEIVEKVKSFSHDANLLYMSTWENGFRHVTCNKEIRTPEQMKGLKIRTMENELHLAVWKAMGANPTPMAYGELYTALAAEDDWMLRRILTHRLFRLNSMKFNHI